jgi:1,4-dihydroxy-2-naphthoyl-CoA hydrolase
MREALGFHLSEVSGLRDRTQSRRLSWMSESTTANDRAKEATGTTSRGTPSLDAVSLETGSAFVVAAGLVIDEFTGSRVIGHIELGPEHHTPWGIVHGGVYTTAIESAASIGASTAVKDRGMVAVGLTNTTHFLRSVTSGRVNVEAVALNQGRTQQLWQVDVKDGAGKLVAHGELRLQNVAASAA